MASVNRLFSWSGSRCVFGLLIAVVPAVALAGQPLTYVGFDKESHSAAAHEGMEEIFSGRCFHSGMRLITVKMMLAVVNKSKDELGYDPATDEGQLYSRGQFPSPPDRTVGVGEGFGLGVSVFERDGVKMVNGNCFGCHSGVVNGQVVAGLGNNLVNQSRPNLLRTRGDNFGPYAVWRLSARMVDPAKEGMVLAGEKTELEELLESSPLPPVDPMPWWTMKYKERDYWYSDSNPHDAVSFAINFTTPHDAINEHRADHIKTVAKALAFARETQSPVYPGALDADLVRKGADIFHGRQRPSVAEGFRSCKTCHGTYTKKHADADYSVPGSWNVDYKFSHRFRNVNTDPAYNEKLQSLQPIVDHIDKLEEYYASIGKPELTPKASVPSKSGYIAPPLVGVWASAPYFHNGSVPTIATVLNSSERPEIWSRNVRDPHAYNLEQVGMEYETLTRSEFEESAARAEGKPFNSQPAIDHGANYDTTQFGHGNMGHTFGDNLTPDERAAVIEFLKSLSGPDM